MKYLFTGLLLCLAAIMAQAQHQLTLKISTEDPENPLAGATVRWKELKRSYITDSTGTVRISDIPDGRQTFIISFVGFEEKTQHYDFPRADDQAVSLIMELAEDDEAGEVVVTATRISRTIANTPTRTEIITGEELDEKGNMKPGEIRMLLTESTGIQTQQTSATSFNAGIRIQGLDGRYTQILRDGYPLYAGFSGGLSIMQIAPLDLKQVEVIKGSASTLYGGGAIAGLVNLVSKTPGPERELNLLSNITSARGLDLSAFYSERYGKLGMTVFGSRNSNAPYDPADIGFTAIPEFERYTINPRLFFYGSKTRADIGLSYITEDRTGGSMDYIKNGTAGFFERNNTDRLTAQFGIRHQLNERASIQLKNSYNHFNRDLSIPDYRFDALQQSFFSELTWSYKRGLTDWIVGTNLITDKLSEQPQGPGRLRDYNYQTYGLFAENAWSPSEKFTLETGLRADYLDEYGLEILPRVSGLIKIHPKLTTRLGAGFGYKTPTVFNEETERVYFRNVLPIGGSARNERSVGGNWDINYRTRIGELGFTINHLFFYTRLNRPLVMVTNSPTEFELINSAGHLDTRGMETNLRLTYDDFKLFIGYTYTDANTHFTADQEWLPLTARHRLNNVLMYEIEEKWKLGLEAYYFSKQRLNDGSNGRSYWITGFMAEKIWEKFSLYINFENFTDTRQSRFDSIYTGPVTAPVFRDIYAPVEGFVINGGLKIRL